jgi:hypothetical protein
MGFADSRAMLRGTSVELIILRMVFDSGGTNGLVLRWVNTSLAICIDRPRDPQTRDSLRSCLTTSLAVSSGSFRFITRGLYDRHHFVVEFLSVRQA